MSATDANRRSRRTAVVALVLGLGVGGPGVAEASGWIGRSGPVAPLTVAPGDGSAYTPNRIPVGGGMSANESIKSTVTRLRGTAVRSAELVPAPDGYDSELAWVRVDVERSDPSLDDVQACWLAGLVQGAVADQMREVEARTADVVGGGLLLSVGPDGKTVSTDLGTGSIVGGQAFGSPDDNTLTELTHVVAAKFGIKVVSVAVLHPLESALEATFAVPDDLAPAWTIDDLREALEGSPTTIEGTYIRFVGPDGRTLLSAGASYRTGEGGLSFADGQDARFGAVHGHLIRQDDGDVAAHSAS